MLSRLLLAAALILVASPTMAADTDREHTAIRDRNTKEVNAHVEDVAGFLEMSVRSDIREECKLDRLKLDIATCNRLSGMDRYFTDEDDETRLKRLNAVRY